MSKPTKLLLDSYLVVNQTSQRRRRIGQQLKDAGLVTALGVVRLDAAMVVRLIEIT